MADIGALDALIFDVDGTLAETEELHREAFNRAFADEGLPYRWDQARYRRLLLVTGGRQRLEHFFAESTGLTPVQIAELAPRLHRAKNGHYAEVMADFPIELRPGVADLLRQARTARLKLAIATTTSRVNLEGLARRFPGDIDLDGFDVVVCGEDVTTLKPDPEVYRTALQRLGLPARQCLAFEDTRNGVESAVGAGLRVVVTPSLYSAGQDFSTATTVLEDLSHFRLSPAVRS
jgi:HAD superfamily hydrolase (TIGR01509 family)